MGFNRAKMNPYRQMVRSLASCLEEGKAAGLGGFEPERRFQPAPDALAVMIFSPHPDDECIVGGLPLRLQRECGWRVVNVAVTQGSRRDRQAERLVELRGACEYLGFELETIGECGLERVTAEARAGNPAKWREHTDSIVQVLLRHRPRAILFPHEQDWNGTHIGVHHLVMDALGALGNRLETYLVETEFWGQNYRPNLLVQVGEEELSELMTALTFHVGEVRRNPYHLTLPSWMTNSVRLGGETVGGQGMAPPDFPFGTVYRLRRWAGGAIEDFQVGGRILRDVDSPATLFKG